MCQKPITLACAMLLVRADRRAAASRPPSLPTALTRFSRNFFRSAFPTIWEPGFLERAAQLAIRVAALQWLLALYKRRYLTDREERGTRESLFPLSPTLY